MTHELLFRDFPAKIHILGEYSILFGSQSVSLPLPKFSGKLILSPNNNSSIGEYLNWLLSKKFDFLDNCLLKHCSDNGLNFNSTVPQGKGLGSSGVIVAAIYDAFSNNKYRTPVLPVIKKNLALMESWFHGKSSGLDPLVSLLSTPLMTSGEMIRSWTPNGSIIDAAYLLDSGIQRANKDLIPRIVKLMNKNKDLTNQLNVCIDSVVLDLEANDIDACSKQIGLLSKMQWEMFREAISTEVQSFWKYGLETGEYYMKLVGGGGGGYYLIWKTDNNIEFDTKLNSQVLEIKSLI